jgi:HSP20 family protein
MTSETESDPPATPDSVGDRAEQYPLRMVSQMVEIERLFDRFMPENHLRHGNLGWSLWPWLDGPFAGVREPCLEVTDDDRQTLIRVALPDVGKEDLEVSVGDGTLTIKFARSGGQRSGEFVRTLALPAGIDIANIGASLKDGVLEIVLPREERIRRRSVAVK